MRNRDLFVNYAYPFQDTPSRITNPFSTTLNCLHVNKTVIMKENVFETLAYKMKQYTFYVSLHASL